MLSKTMPFRAKEVDQLLKQAREQTLPSPTLLWCVVKGRFTFKPDEKWKNVSAEARDLVSSLILLDPVKRLTIQQVKEHPWCADAIAKCAASMPKEDVKDTKGKKTSAVATGGNKRFRRGSDAYVSREQQFWYAMEISPPSNMQQQGGVKIGSDGKFQMENVSEEMRCASQPSHGSLSLNPSLPPRDSGGHRAKEGSDLKRLRRTRSTAAAHTDPGRVESPAAAATSTASTHTFVG
ncbi:MAG: hypothetical protein SGPRY_005853 [Prymnesium sp.]